MNMIPIRSHLINRPAAVSPPIAEAGDAVLSRFRRWKGKSGKSYLFSVYTIFECPDYIGAVVIAAAGGELPHLVWIGDSGEAGAGLAEAMAMAAEMGAVEAHVHLLAADEASRRTIVRDLDRRH